MTVDEFAARLALALPPGLQLPNPGGGTSTIVRITPTTATYRRGKSDIMVGIRDLFDAYVHFQGQEVDSLSLRDSRPNVFDSSYRPGAGHNCNRTFLFMALAQIGLADAIMGAGKRGDPFRTRFR